MDWTKIPTTLITKRYTDYELISIIKFQLLWAELEEQPDKKTALRYMTARQYDTAMAYLDSIATGVGDAVSSVKRKREVEKIRYSKNKDLRNILPAECQQNVSRLPSQIREDKIREDKSVYNARTRVSPPTLEEVLNFAKQMHEGRSVGGFFCTRTMAEEFWSNYEANGWIIGNEYGTPIRDWKAKLRQWCLKEMRKPDKDGIPNCPVQAKGDR